MQQRPDPTSYNSQQSATPQRNPFNDSNLALSQRSARNSSASFGAEPDYLSRGGYGGAAAGAGMGAAAGAAAGAATRLRDGSQSSRTLERSSSYSRYSDLESPVAADPLARNPALQPAPYTVNSPYANPAPNAPPSYNNSQQNNFVSTPSNSYGDGPYNRFSSSPWDPRLQQSDINPDDIEDDGDDGLNRGPSGGSGRRSVLGFGSSRNSLPAGAAVAGAGAGAAAGGGVVDAIRSVSGSAPGGNYGPVPASDRAGAWEKSQDLAAEAARRKRLRIIFIILGTLVVCGAIAGGVAGGVISSRKNSSGGGSSSSPTSSGQQPGGNSNLDLNSPQIQSLMNNSNLHRVFMGVDYTPMNAQYPDCLNAPPSQDNITMDMAILSQLTKTVRLYGTDCNQTDMILYALDQLKITDMKLWLGVWLDNNQTTNDRGMNAMWDILSRKGQDPFAGVIIGNEVLYRKDMTETALATLVEGVRSNFTSKKYSLPIAVADLGDNWNAQLVQNVDVVMSNVHPFFGGVEASKAAEWTWDFWETHDVVLTAGNSSKQNIISETGWPSAGGNDCGASNCTSKDEGAVAGIDGMNTFMDGFVCPSLHNNTNYFW